MPSATIQRITEIKIHPNADALELAKVLGWQVVVKKGEFKPGALVVYVEIDSIMEDRPEYEFLRNKDFRVKTIKLRKEWSQGLCLPITVLNGALLTDDFLQEGRDVSDLVGASHYEKPIPEGAGEMSSMSLPFGMSKTDSNRLQTHPRVLQELQGLDVYISQKLDGTSATFAHRAGEIAVCSRGCVLKEGNGVYWRVFKELDLENKLKLNNMNIAIRGEIVGPGVQQNPLGLDELQFFAFDVLDLNTNTYYSHNLRNMVFAALGLQHPPEKIMYNFSCTMEEAEAIAEEQRYPNGKQGEGVVIRPIRETFSDALNGRLACKVISKSYEM